MPNLTKTEIRPFKGTDVVAFDFETTGFQYDPGARIFAAVFTWCDDGHTEVYREPDFLFLQRLREFWKSPCQGIAHHLQFEWWFTLEHKFEVNPKKQLHDTEIQHQYISNLALRHGLDHAVMDYTGYKKEWDDIDTAIAKAAKIYKRFDKIPEPLMTKYQIIDGERTALLHSVQFDHVKPKSEYYNEIELIKVTVEMQRRGILVNVGNANNLIKKMDSSLTFNKYKAEKIAGRKINLNSIVQVSKVLYPDSKIQQPTGNEALLQIDHPLVDCILLHRSYTKGIAMVKSYLKAAEGDGFLHPEIKTNRARTGRASSGGNE